MPAMTSIELQIVFSSPTFMRGSNQDQVEVRLSELKAEIRKVWRMVTFVQLQDLDDLRSKELTLFGNSGVPGNRNSKSGVPVPKCKSKLQFRTLVAPKLQSCNTALRNIKGNKFLDDLFYLGYGIVESKDDFLTRKCFFSYLNEELDEKSIWKVNLSFPKSENQTLVDVFTLMNEISSIGARRNNGFGSINIINFPEGESCSKFVPNIFTSIFNDSGDTDLRWPANIPAFANGKSVWRTKEPANINGAFQKIAEMRRKLNEYEFAVSKNQDHRQQQQVFKISPIRWNPSGAIKFQVTSFSYLFSYSESAPSLELERYENWKKRFYDSNDWEPCFLTIMEPHGK